MEDISIIKQLFLEQDLYDYAQKLYSKTIGEKRPITDIAISKIPYVTYPGLQTNENLIIHELGEYLMHIAKEKNNSDEVLATYDLANNISIEKGMGNIIAKTGICCGSQYTIDPYADPKTADILIHAKAVTVVSLHNHPSCSSFSMEDIYAFTKETPVRLMVVISNSGELYYMSKSEDYDYISARKYMLKALTETIPNVNSEYVCSAEESRKVADAFLCDSRKVGIIYQHVLGTNKELLRTAENILSPDHEQEDISEDKDYDER